MAAVIPNEEMETPMLFKIDSQGVTRVWRAWTTLNEDGSATENNESGIEGGTLSGIPVTVTAGKNIGKKNETTALQQANKRIQTKYTKKLREGYVENLEEFTQQGVMAAHEWKVSKHRMSQYALHQPKLDGIRLKVIKRDDTTVHMSKSNKEFKPFLYELPWANYLRNEMVDGEELDGEMYIHGLELNEIASLVMSYKMTTLELLEYCEDTDDGLKISLNKKTILDQVYTGEFSATQLAGTKTPAFCESMGAIEVGKNKGWIFPGATVDSVQVVGTSELEFWVFDVPEADVMAEQRNENLRKWDQQDAVDHGIRTVIAEEFNIDDIEEVNAEHVANGFEGTMVRLPAGMYAFGERSAVLQKFKLFHDQEWVIEGYELDREGNPTFTFTSDTGDTFSSRPTGNRAWRAKLLRDMDEIIGKSATIRYQMLYQDTLVPQFGRVIAIRDYE